MSDSFFSLYLYAFPTQQILAYCGATELPRVAGFTAPSTLLAVFFAALSWFVVEYSALRINGPFNGSQLITATMANAPTKLE